MSLNRKGISEQGILVCLTEAQGGRVAGAWGPWEQGGRCLRYILWSVWTAFSSPTPSGAAPSAFPVHTAENSHWLCPSCTRDNAATGQRLVLLSRGWTPLV